MTLENFLINNVYSFLLILIRYLGIFLIAPVFGNNVIPVRIKVGTAFFLALVTISLFQGVNGVVMPENNLLVLLQILSELTIGLVFGFIAFIPFAAIQLAGRFIDLRMGFGMVNIIDPINGESIPMMAQFKNALALLLFLSINGHYILIKSLYDSFQYIPLTTGRLKVFEMDFIFRNIGDIFIIAFKIALPIIGTLIIADIILGFMARTVPQLNIFIVGLPLKILVGFIILIFSMYFMVNTYQDIFKELFVNLKRVIYLFK